MKRIIAILSSALVMIGLTALPANAHNARVHNSSTSEGRLGAHNENVGRWLYPGGSTAATTDYVFIPAGYIGYHYYNGRYVGTYGPGAYIHVGGVYQHYFFIYTR